MKTTRNITTIARAQNVFRYIAVLSVYIIITVTSQSAQVLAATPSGPTPPSIVATPSTTPSTSIGVTSSQQVGLIQNAHVAIPADLLLSDGRVVRLGGHIVMPKIGEISISLDHQGVLRTSVVQARMWDLTQSGAIMVNEKGGVVLTQQGREQLLTMCCMNTRGVQIANVASMSNGVFTLGYDPMMAARPGQFTESHELSAQMRRTK